MKKPLIILTGPTAVGKTESSILLAKKINGEIISVDSMQVYKKMDIGTAKIKPTEMMGITHHMIDVWEPDFDGNVFDFKTEVNACLKKIYDKNKVPILVGGTGFYLQAILYDVQFTNEHADNKIRKDLENKLQEKGVDFIYDLLESIDPEYAKTTHKNNTKRVIRALEYYYETDELFSEHNKKEAMRKSPYDFKYFCLTLDRKTLYERIDYRVDQMIENGLIDEVKNLLECGYSKDLVSMQGLGYKEIVRYLNGEISKEEAIYILKRDTRHFAKRQLTWFKREKDVIFIDKNAFKTTNELVEKLYDISKNILWKEKLCNQYIRNLE